MVIYLMTFNPFPLFSEGFYFTNGGESHLYSKDMFRRWFSSQDQIRNLEFPDQSLELSTDESQPVPYSGVG